MDIKEIHNKLEQQCPSDFKINEIIPFAYPYRRLIVKATVNKSPEQSIQQVYSVLLRTIEAGYNTENELINFLGLYEEDFILRELYFLRERGYADFVSNHWIVTNEGKKFIEDNSILKMLEKEDFEFLIDAIEDKAIAKDFRTYKVDANSNKLKIEINYSNRSSELLNNKYEQLADIYKRQNKGKAYLVDYDKNNIKYDSFDKEYRDYFLIEYIPSKEKENELEPFIDVRNTDDDFSKNVRLTKLLSKKYPSILYQFTSSDRATIADLISNQKENIVEEFNEQQIEKELLPETKTLSIWETQSQFIEALNSVRNNILIESPWIKRATLQYLELFEDALKRNVKIIILYGIKNNDEHDYSTMKKIEELSSKYKTLHLIHLPSHFERVGNYKMVGTHRKLIIKDFDYYIQGSFNFLSFNKKEGQKVANEESILISKNVQKKWVDVLKEYQINISIKNENKKHHSVSKNLNVRDVTQKDARKQSDKTIFAGSYNNDKFAILELSTKAVKLLIGPSREEYEQNGFSFNQFYRTTEFTGTGKYLNKDNILDRSSFIRYVLPFIRKMLSIVKEKNINTVYTIATAAYRTATNREEILDLIFERTGGLNVKILPKSDEAIATLVAFKFTKPKHITLYENSILIDQGGGSTEISFFKDVELIQSKSYDIGTNLLENIFFEDRSINIKEAFDKNELQIKAIIANDFNTSNLKNNDKISCIAVGTAITRATKKRGNAKQHGTILSIEKLQDRFSEFKESFINDFDNNISLLYSDVNNVNKRNNIKRQDLTSALGIPFFIEIMKHFNIEEIVVSGTGLWYGMFFQKLYNI